MGDSSTDMPWPAALVRCLVPSAQVLDASCEEEDRPGCDSLGNPGRVHVVRHAGRLGVPWPRTRVVGALESQGLLAVRSTAEETDLAAPLPPAGSQEDEDPFVLERRVEARVRGREFPGRQRAAVLARLEALRREAADAATEPSRREAAAKMAAELDDGLRSTVEARAVVRRFTPTAAVRDPVESMGSVVPLVPGSRIVYSVLPATPEEAHEDDGETRPMAFHVIALGAREAFLLYTGGVHGSRHLRDLEASPVHHAWFANRERAKTDATAPWIGRALYRALAGEGRGEIVVHRRRDAEPIAVERVGEGTRRLAVGSADREVPVLRCRTARGDEMEVLADPESPLVLRLYETGAELVRTIEAVRGPAAAGVVA